MSETIEYWRQAWDSAKSDSDVNENAGKTLSLLSQYAGSYKRIPLLNLSIAWGGKYGRFFSGRWNTHHGSEVQAAIENFYHRDGHYAHIKRFHSVEFILACVKKEISYKSINPKGDLAKILDVIKEKTGINYSSLDARAIRTDYKSGNHL